MAEVGSIAEPAEGLPDGVLHEGGYGSSVAVLVGHHHPDYEHRPADPATGIVESSDTFGPIRLQGQVVVGAVDDGQGHGDAHHPAEERNQLERMIGIWERSTYPVGFGSPVLILGQEIASSYSDKIGRTPDPWLLIDVVVELLCLSVTL